MNKVMVSGCFDLLHSGHITFLNNASKYGDLYVCIGSDETIYNLKGRYPIITQDERKYMIESISCVKECKINNGSGILDFLKELEEIKPSIFVVNEDGNSPEKYELCKSKNIEYIVLKRETNKKFPIRTTSSLRTNSTIPFRIDLAGGWLDQPFVNKLYHGKVITISIEPTIEFNNRSGMGSSTRNKAIELWQTQLPNGNPMQLAKILFSYENFPGTKEISGSQDSIGIVFEGLNVLHYSNENYWPDKIESIKYDPILDWLESCLYLIPLKVIISS
jgi:cytidyltransferase-like protein